MYELWQKEYKKKLISAQKAVEFVKSGDWVDYGWCVGHPYHLDKALAARAKELQDIKIRGGIALFLPEIFKIEKPQEHFTWNSWHFSGVDRKIYDIGCAFYNPMRYSELPRYYRENIGPIDVAMFQVAPMDRNGFFNFGPQASHQMAICEQAEIVIVEVNKNMPRCLGGYEEAIHISRVDHIVEGDNPQLPELASPPPSETDKKISRLVVEDIPNGACLQLGIGGMPNAVGMMIAESDLRDLGVHSEMYVDAFVNMYNKGKITGAKKSIDRFRQVFSFAAGTSMMYEFLNDNPAVANYPVDYVNNPYLVGKIDNFISVNNAIEVDLFGQVCSESAGVRHISGTGGQLDFVMGAYLSKGGKSFICLSSTYGKEEEKKSRIVCSLNPGTIVTDPRTTAHFIVTEYGKINLKGLSTWQRAEAIISIAHPDFRQDLECSAQQMKIWRRSNKNVS